MLWLHPFTNFTSTCVGKGALDGAVLSEHQWEQQDAVWRGALPALAQHHVSGVPWGSRRQALLEDEGSEKPQGGQRQCRYVTRSNGHMGDTTGAASEQNSVKVSLETYCTIGSSHLWPSFFPQMLGYKNMSFVAFFYPFCSINYKSYMKDLKVVITQ